MLPDRADAKKDVLFLACRHHILEIVLASVFKSSMGSSSSGPEITIFKRFKQSWKTIDQSQFETVDSSETARTSVIPNKQDIIEFSLNQLQVFQPRGDYRELLLLTIIFLGGKPPCGIKFAAPGALHHARWMNKALYSIKLWMFRRQFSVTAREERGLLDVCLFVVLIYIQFWFTAPCPVSAPNNDLMLLKRLYEYKSVNPVISELACKKFATHLWYLSEEVVGLAFFDSNVPTEEKRAMIKSLTEHNAVRNL